MNNREKITEAIAGYMKGIPNPKDMPTEIRVEIRFAESTETHHIILGEGEEKKPSASAQVQALVDMYNEICGGRLPQVRITTERRKKALIVRLRERTLGDFEELFKKASASDFLCGKNDRGWKANFDWLINESNMAKVLEGNYDNNTDSKTTRAGTRAATSFDVDESLKRAMARTYGNKE